MRIAVLINHNTAAKFYAEMLKKLGHIVYLPLYCSIENKTLQYADVLNYRNIPIDNDVKILDSFDFYDNDKNVKHIFNILNNKFDVIITLHAINNNLNILLTQSQKKVYYIVWGRETDDHIIGYKNIYRQIISKKNLYFSVAHKYIHNSFKNDVNFNKFRYMPLGMFDMSKYENTYEPINNSILIIISRLTIHKQFYRHVYDLIRNIITRCPNQIFCICGKENEKEIDSFPEKNVHFKTFDTNHEVYEYIKSCKLNINISVWNSVLQYSPFECACIGIPTLYAEKSALDVTITNTNTDINKKFPFRYNNIDDLSEKIKLYANMNVDKLKKIYKDFNQSVYNILKIDNLLIHWQKELK